MQKQALIFSTAILFALMIISCSKPEFVGRAEVKMVLQDEHFALFRYTEQGQEWFAVRTSPTVRSGTFTVEVVLDNDLTVRDSRLVSYPLSRGREVLRPDFLDQFKGKTATDPIRVSRDIHAVTGATMSSAAVADAVRDSLAFASRHRQQMVR